MKLNEIIELAAYRFAQKLPLWESMGTVWAWWLTRKLLLYGTCWYVAETLLGHRRRRLGTSPLRHLRINRWLPKVLDKDVDESTRTFLQHLGYKILGNRHPRETMKEKSKFYSEVPFQPPLTPLPGDDPIPPVEGDIYPPGFYGLMRTLKVLGNFPVESCTKILKSCEIKHLKANEVLCDFGDPDDSFHIVVSGSISVSILDSEFGHIQLKSVKANEHILSLFSIINCVIEGRILQKPIHACAEEDSVVCQVALSTIRDYFWEEQPEDLIPFLKRALTKIRGLYFEGLTEIAGLNRNLMKVYAGHSNYQPFEDCIEEEGFREKAVEGIRKYVNLTFEDLKECTIGALSGGSAVTRVGVIQNSLVYIYKGELIMVNESRESKHQKVCKEVRDGKRFVQFVDEYTSVFYQSAGTLIGSWSLTTNSVNYYTSRVPEGQRVIIVEVPDHVVKRSWERDPLSFLPFVKQMLQRWSNFSKQIDYCLQWAFVAPGKVVYRRGDSKIETFLVLNGRLRYRVHGSYLYVKRMELEARSQYGHYEPGDWFGFVECVVAAQSMQKTVVADRYSELVILPSDLITLLYQKFPHVMVTMTNYLSLRIHKDYNYNEVTPPKYKYSLDNITCPKYALVRRAPCSALAVFPLMKDIPGEIYCKEICRHYPRGSKFLTFNCFKAKYPQKQHLNMNQLSEWMSPYDYEVDDLGLIVLLGSVDEVDLWNTFIARQADFIQILATAKCSVHPYKVEKMISVDGWKAVKDFVFIHPAHFQKHTKNPDDTPKLTCRLPSGSVMWLAKRPWLDTHHHVRFPECAFKLMKNFEKCYWTEYEEYKRIIGVDKHSDIARIGRWLSNTMVGLVLGGGGAKGAAHIGILEYLSQLDLPIDYICGVSIGAFVGGLLALHQDLEKVEKNLTTLFGELKTPSRFLSDLTIPYSSIFRGRCFDEFIQNSFNDIRIEDLWVPYFPVTTDITGRHSRAHKHGLMWFYIRASMTLTMVFPPLANPRDLHLLMDGGYSEILPGNHLRSNGVRYIIAADIGDENGIPLFNIGYECSGIKCVIQNLMPVNHWPSVPSKFSFLEQLHYIAARKYVHLLRKADRRLVYIRPAVEFYTGKDFHKVDAMRYMGYYTTKKRFGAVRRGIPTPMMWTLLNTHLLDHSPGSGEDEAFTYEYQIKTEDEEVEEVSINQPTEE